MTPADHLTFAENLKSIAACARPWPNPDAVWCCRPLSFEEVQAAASIWGALVLLMRRKGC